MNYYIDFVASWKNLDQEDTIKQKAEKVIRSFIFNKADIVRLTRHTWIDGLLFGKKKGHDEDSKFIITRENLEPYFIRKERNNKKYYDIEQPFNQQYEHYFYKFSSEIKKVLNEMTLFFPLVRGTNIPFYGFEDPTFYKGDTMIASVISYEQQIFLSLSPTEAEDLKNKGVFIEYIQI